MAKRFISALILFGLAAFAFASSGGNAGGPTPDESLAWLKAGNKKFLAGAPLTTNLSLERRLDTAKHGQKPFVTVLGCSDSREPLEAIFHVGVGDLFCVRVAGNVADTDEIGTVEYGVEHLGTPLLVVMGHSSCGAVTAVVKGAKVEGSIPKLVSKIVPAALRAKAAKGGDGEPAVINAAIRENVWESIAQLIARSPIIAELVESGKLKIVGAFYRIDTGEIEWLGAHPEEGKLAKEAIHGGHGGVGSVFVASLWPTAILAAWLLACFYLFVSEVRLLKSLRFRGRFFLALCAFIFGALFLALYTVHEGAVLGEGGLASTLAFFALPKAVFLLMAVVYTMSVRASLHRYIEAMRASLLSKAE